jgi:hypothetical protein
VQNQREIAVKFVLRVQRLLTKAHPSARMHKNLYVFAAERFFWLL